jgi:prefoldin subunit 5
VNAIKEQQKEIEEQRKLLRAQSQAMRTLMAEVGETRKTLRKVKAQTATSHLVLIAAK